MPKVVLFIATSLDGYIAASDGTVDKLNSDLGFEQSNDKTQDKEI